MLVQVLRMYPAPGNDQLREVQGEVEMELHLYSEYQI